MLCIKLLHFLCWIRSSITDVMVRIIWSCSAFFFEAFAQGFHKKHDYLWAGFPVKAYHTFKTISLKQDSSFLPDLFLEMQTFSSLAFTWKCFSWKCRPLPSRPFPGNAHHFLPFPGNADPSFLTFWNCFS